MPSTSSTTFAFVDEITAIKEAITSRLLTEVGYVWQHPNYGSAVLESLKGEITAATNAALENAVRAALLPDSDWYVVTDMQIEIDTMTSSRIVKIEIENEDAGNFIFDIVL